MASDDIFAGSPIWQARGLRWREKRRGAFCFNCFGSSTCSHRISLRAWKTTGVISSSPRNSGATGPGANEYKLNVVACDLLHGAKQFHG